jgi:hypothetical protein
VEHLGSTSFPVSVIREHFAVICSTELANRYPVPLLQTCAATFSLC